MQCENCGGKVFLPGQQSDMIGEGVCANCGRPYRHQPGGENVMPGEMEARGMPAPGERDMTGNPLQEGIWATIDGGWQNRMKRDESYASLRRADRYVGMPGTKCPNCGAEGTINDESGRCIYCGYTIPYDGWEQLEGHGNAEDWARDQDLLFHDPHPSIPRNYGSVRHAQNPYKPEAWRATGGGGAWLYPQGAFNEDVPVIHWQAHTHVPAEGANEGGRPVLVDTNSPQIMRDKPVVHVGQPGWTHSDMIVMGNQHPNRFQFSDDILPGVMYDDGTAKLYPGVHPEQDQWEQVMHQALGTQPVSQLPSNDDDLWNLD